MKKLPEIPKLKKKEEEQEGQEKFVYSKQSELWTYRIKGEHADKIKRIMHHNNYKTKTAVLDYIISKYLDPLDFPPVPKPKEF